MAISLEKGQRIQIGLSKVSVGLGWDPNDGTGFDFDLDASAFNAWVLTTKYLVMTFLFSTTIKNHLMVPSNQLVMI